MAISIEKKRFNDNLVLVIKGKVDPNDTLTISKKIVALSKKRFKNAVVDLSNIEYLSSHWIGAFAHTWKVLHDRNKNLIFLIPKGFIRNQFTTAQLGRVFTIIESLEELDALEDSQKEEEKQ